ncbi:MAG: rRNA cytosine-C5-methylase [Rikenellaceae bacterium]|nr:rRNA cytosine-C5-methylase [Rikenellaceae bacterium]
MLLPDRFVARLREQLGADEAESLCAALDTPPSVAVRLHPMRGAACSLPLAEAVPWSERGHYLSERPSFTLDTAFQGGAYYVQEASSQFVERLLPADIAGARLLDMCAAPGGKTTLYATAVGASGLVVANEIDRKRVLALADNVRKWGLGNVAVTCGDSAAAARMESWYDVVAIDAPCSGEGMFRKDDQAREEWSEQNVRLCAARQDEILENGWRALKGGGTLLYSTCTFNREEDEGSLERFLASYADEVEEAPEVVVDPAWGIVTGRVGAFQTFRFMPHKARGEGFFAAVARKSSEVGGGRLPKAKRAVITPVAKGDVTELKRWLQEPERMTFGMAGDTCYAWFAEQAEAVKRLSEQLSVLYSGVAMGQIFKGKLKPEQALAHFVGLNREALPVAELNRDEALAYLRKQEVAADRFGEGMNLVACETLPLGFAKRIGARVNNLYPNALRILKND